MSNDDLVGERLGSFTVLAILGEGAMAKVYRARQEKQNREVALKVIRRIPGDNEDSAARFRREKSVLEQLNHPHIMPIYEYSANSDFLWIASPLITGGTLEDRLRRGSVSLSQAVDFIKQLGGALDMANSISVIHRDIKPSNVLIDNKEGRDHLYLTDFGVAKLLEAEGLTAPGMTLGTPEYMSPEQVLGKPLDGRSDQYALAVMCYELLSGKVPFEGKMMAVMQNHAKTPPPSLGKSVNPEVERALFRALSKDPNKRYASSSEFAQALEEAAQGAGPASGRRDQDVPRFVPGRDLPETVKVAVEAPLENPPPLPQENSRLPLIVGASLAVLAVVAMFFWGRHSAAPPPLPLAYCVHAGESYEIALQAPATPKKSLGPGRHPRFWGNEAALLVTNDEAKGKFDLVKMDLKGENRQNLTKHPSAEQVGTVSPDGAALIFASKDQLHRLDPKTAKASRMALGKGHHRWPSFSPKGDSLAYASDAEGTFAIWVLDLSSKKQRRLSAPAAGVLDLCPAWSPDGQKIVFERQQSGATQLVVVNLEGKEQPLEGTGSAHQPSWSPSSQIVYAGSKGIYSCAPDKPAQASLMVEASPGQELMSPVWGADKQVP